MHVTFAELVLELFTNAVGARSRTVEVHWRADGEELAVVVRDDGCGMDADEQIRALDPFHTDGTRHPGRKIGLGLPFARQAAQAAGGLFRLESEPGAGTRVAVRLPAHHIDAPPDGDAAGAIVAMLAAHGPDEVTVTREVRGGTYRVSRRELEQALGEIDSVEGLALVRRYLESQEEDDGKVES